MVTRGWEEERVGELLFNGYRVCRMKRVLWMDGGDGCATI